MDSITPPQSTISSTNSSTTQIIIITVVFVCLGVLFQLISAPVHNILSNYNAFTYFPEHTTVKSEYTIGEQLSKVYLFFTFVLALYGYLKSTDSQMVILSIGYVILGLVTYMAESNMITELAQPILGLGLISFIAIMCFRNRLWLSDFALGLAVTFLSLGSLTDLLHENREWFARFEPLPEFVLNPPEELFDLMGVMFLCISACFCFHRELFDFVKSHTIGFLALVASIFLISFGNGWLHFAYIPSNSFYLMGLLVSLMGFALFVITDYSFLKLDQAFHRFLWPIIFIFFVVLPSVYNTPRNSTVFLIWIPFMIFAAIVLWRNHQTNLS